MRHFAGYLPWAGLGTTELPYQTFPLQIALQSRALLVLNGYSCFDPNTGLVISDRPTVDLQLGDLLNNITRVVEVGSGVLCEASLDDDLYSRLYTFHEGHGGDLTTRAWRCEGSLDEFLTFIEQERSSHLDRLAIAHPTLNWTGATIGSAFEVLDELRLGDALEQELWSYYRQVFTPALPTDEQPSPLFNRVGQRAVSARIDRCKEFVSASDDVSNPIRRSEMCYWIIVYTECLRAADRLA